MEKNLQFCLLSEPSVLLAQELVNFFYLSDVVGAIYSSICLSISAVRYVL